MTYSITGFKNSESQSVINVLPLISTSATTTSNTGNYSISVSGADDDNYSFSYQNGTLTVKQASLTVTAEDKTREQGQPNPEFTLAYSDFKNNETASVLDVLPTISCVSNINSPAGFYDIILTGGSDNNYQ